MMDAHPKTIQIFLPYGEPRGIRIAEITTRIVRAVLVPRSKLQVAAERTELAGVGVYFLFGESDDQAKPCVYIGEAEDCYHRLGQHNKSKDFWNTAVAVVSKTQTFTKAHAKYLEWYCLGRAKEVARFAIDNTTMPNEPHVPEPMLADLMDSFETLSILLSTLGYPAFDSVRQLTAGDEETDEQDVFYCTRRGANAKGTLVDDGFVVFEGSFAARDMPENKYPAIAALRIKLKTGGVLEENESSLSFVSDHLFNSPSAAAGMVVGRAANGWTEWKRRDGKTLDELKRQ